MFSHDSEIVTDGLVNDLKTINFFFNFGGVYVNSCAFFQFDSNQLIRNIKSEHIQFHFDRRWC